MEDFKKELWETDGLDIKYSSLNFVQIQEVFKNIAINSYTSFEKINNKHIFLTIRNILKSKINIETINENIGFNDLCSSLELKISDDDETYVVWNYNSIDKFKIDTLSNYWNYIWYGPSDEACLIYFPNLKLVALVTDYCRIYTN